MLLFLQCVALCSGECMLSLHLLLKFLLLVCLTLIFNHLNFTFFFHHGHWFCSTKYGFGGQSWRQSTKLGLFCNSEVGLAQAALLRVTLWQIQKAMREETSVRYNIPLPCYLFVFLITDTGEMEDLHSKK